MKTTTKLAISNIKVNRSRSILIGVAIFLTTTLLASIGLTGMTLINTQLKNAAANYGSYYAMYSRVTERQLQEIKNHGQFHTVGASTIVSYLTQDKTTLVGRYVDNNTMRLLNASLSEGHMPEKVNEIAGQKESFEAYGLERPRLGDQIALPYRPNEKGQIKTMEFTISGFFPSAEEEQQPMEAQQFNGKMYQIYLSEAFVKEMIPEERDREYSVCFQMYNYENLNYDHMIDKIETLGEELGINKNSIKINALFLMSELNPGTEVIMTCILIMAMVIFVSIIVIYNIFHVGMIQRIKEYGKIKAMGATKKQLRKIILKEGSILAGVTIPLGIIAGILVTYCIYNFLFLRGFDGRITEKVTIFYPAILLGVALLSYVTVLISLGKPMRVAANISAVEAIRYQESGMKGKGTRQGGMQMNLLRLTMSNLSANRKRTITTILTMGLSCILFVIISNVAGNMNAEYETRQQIEYGRFRIELSGEYHDTEYPESNFYNIQKSGPFKEEFLTKLRQIDGVTTVKTRKVVEIYEESGDMKDEERYGLMSVVTEEEFNWLVKNSYRGIVDYQNTAQQDGVIYMYDHWMETYGYNIGDSFKCKIIDGDTEIPFEAEILGTCGHSNDGSYTITEETFKKLDIKGDMTSIVFVDCKKGTEDAVLEKLRKLIDENEAVSSEYINLNVYKDTLKQNNDSIRLIKSLSYALLIMVGIIGFMNMANTIITSIVTRRREIGVLQALGMTDRQLNKMLQLEGVVFTGGTLLICLSLGNVLGYLSFQYCKTQGFLGLNEYRLPVLELGILVIIIILLQSVLSFLLGKSLSKDSIIERISYQG